MRQKTKEFYEFGRFRIDLTERLLLCGDETLSLTQKAFDVLLVLVEERGHIVEKDVLMEKVWPDRFVEEGNLSQNIYILRKLLGNMPNGKPFIETIPRRGYRFVGEAVSSSGDIVERSPAVLRENIPTPLAFPDSAAAGWSGAAFEKETIVGREEELRRLESLLQKSINGSGRIIFITGEPGIGKTALAYDFLRRARATYPNLFFSRGHCAEQYGASEAYMPFLDAISELLIRTGPGEMVDLFRTYAPIWCLQLPAVFSSTELREQLQQETVGATKERMLREMGDCLGSLAERSPVVLMLEDLHWADHSSIDLLGYLCRRINSQRLLIIGTYRPADVELSNHPLKRYKREMEAHDQCEEIALRLLRSEHIASYLDARFSPNDFPPELSDLIQRKTEGHPLFATRLAQYLSERGDIARVSERWSLTRRLSEMDLEVPASVLSIIRKKIESLDEEDRRALQYASIEGEEFLSVVVAELLSANAIDLEERLDRLDKVNRLIETLGEEELNDCLTMRYRFAHALYQNVLYEDMVSKRRIQLHSQAGERLIEHFGDSSPHIAAQLAMHFERGRDFSRAIHYLIKVADNAARVYATAEAERHYTQALELAEKLSDNERNEKSLTLYQKRGAANFTLSRFDEAKEDYERVIEGAQAAGAADMEQAALNGLINVLFYSHRMGEMAQRTQEALKAAEQTRNEALRLETLGLIAIKQMTYGELSEAREMADEIISLATTLNHEQALLGGLTLLGELLFHQSEYEGSIEMMTRAVSLAPQLGDGFMHLYALFFLGLSKGNQGRMSEALETLNEMMEIAARNGDRFWLSRVPNSIGWIHRELNDFDHALEHDHRGVEIAQQDSVLEAEANSLINLGYDYIQTGESHKPQTNFQKVEAIFKRDSWMAWRYNIRLQAGKAEYHLAQGDLNRSEEYALRLLELATEYQSRKYMAVAHKLLSRIAVAQGDLAEAESQLKTALDLLEQFPAPLVAWRVYAVLGRLNLQKGDAQSAREAFGKAAALIREIAANLTDERLRKIFLESVEINEIIDSC